MLLRASGQQNNETYDLSSVIQDDVDPGVADGDHLRALAEATVRGDWLTLGGVRRAAEASMGPQAVTDALVVAAAFNGITRVADATGIPLDANTEQETSELRAEIGIDEFAYSRKDQRYR